MDSVKYIEMKKIALFILLMGFSNLQAQIGIGTDTPDASSILDISPTGNDRGIQSSDHKGWVKLDGRLKSSLTSSQQARATTLGIGSNLPNADNAYLVQNGGTLGGVTGTNEKTILQANLPNVNFSVAVSSEGNHNHSSNASGNPGLVIKNSYNTTTALDNGQSNEINLVSTSSLSIYNNGNHTYTVDIASFNSATSGSHAHTVTVNSGGSGTALDITPKSLSINTFVFLGN